MVRHARTLRIIAGTWRSRKISFPDQEEIRPTPDRVRETLFNWINASVPGARCLELFAGSGILSMEALSRGAGHATLVEKDTRTCEALLANLELLSAPASSRTVHCCTAEDWLATRSGKGLFDLVFLDPPFAGHDWRATLSAVAASELLVIDGFIYCESKLRLEAAQLPSGYEIHRQKKAGQVHFCLLRRVT